MMDFLDSALILKVTAALVSVNLLLSAVDAGLEKIKDKTSTDLDNKVYAAVHKITSVLGSALDWFAANRAHKK